MHDPKEPLRGKMLVSLDRQLTEERDVIRQKHKQRRVQAALRRHNIKMAFLSFVRFVLQGNIPAQARGNNRR